MTTILKKNSNEKKQQQQQEHHPIPIDLNVCDNVATLRELRRLLILMQFIIVSQTK